MPTRRTLRELFVHNDWARDRVLDWAAGLDAAALDRPFEMGLGSLRATLGHLWQAEHIWLERWRGAPQPGMPALPPRVAVAELAQRARDTAAEREALLSALPPDGESRPITYANAKGETFTYPLGDLMLHVCTHGTHHRAQALHMLRQAGREAQNIDYIFFRIERPTARRPETPLVDYFGARGIRVRDTLDAPATFDRDTVHEFFHFGDWARRRLHTLAEDLSDEQLDRPHPVGLGTLRRTLLHMQDAEQNWLANWTRGSTPGFAELPHNTSMDTLSELAEHTAVARNTFLSAKSNGDLAQPLLAQPAEDMKLYFRLGETMLQVCMHGVHHRAQASNMLRALGVAPPVMSYLGYCQEMAARPT